MKHIMHGSERYTFIKSADETSAPIKMSFSETVQAKGDHSEVKTKVKEWKIFYEKSRNLHEVTAAMNEEAVDQFLEILKNTDPWQSAQENIRKMIILKSVESGIDEKQAREDAENYITTNQLPDIYKDVHSVEIKRQWNDTLNKVEQVEERKYLSDDIKHYQETVSLIENARNTLKKQGIKSYRVLVTEIESFKDAEKIRRKLSANVNELLAYSKKYNLQKETEGAEKEPRVRTKPSKTEKRGEGFMVRPRESLDEEDVGRIVEAQVEQQASVDTYEEQLHKLILEWNQKKRIDPRGADRKVNEVGRLLKEMRMARERAGKPVVRNKDFRITDRDLEAYIEACIHDGLPLVPNNSLEISKAMGKNLSNRSAVLMGHMVEGAEFDEYHGEKNEGTIPDRRTKEPGYLRRLIERGYSEVSRTLQDKWREINRHKHTEKYDEAVEKEQELAGRNLHNFFSSLVRIPSDKENIWRKAHGLPLLGKGLIRVNEEEVKAVAEEVDKQIEEWFIIKKSDKFQEERLKKEWKIKLPKEIENLKRLS